MKKLVRVALAVATVAVGLGIAGARPAAAHGTCATVAWTPVPAVLSVAYGGQFDCSDVHPDIYVYLCLERTASMTVQIWQNVQCGLQGHARSANHVHAYGFLSEPCVGFYRTRAWGYNAGQNHSDVDVSPPVACASAATAG